MYLLVGQQSEKNQMPKIILTSNNFIEKLYSHKKPI